MTSVSSAETPASSGTLAASFMVASLLLTPVSALGAGAAVQIQPKVTIAGSPRSFGESHDLFAEMIIVPDEPSSLIEFYAGLVAQQEALGQEFAEVLYDNVWDLYAR